MKAKDVVKEIAWWTGSKSELVEKLFVLYKKEFDARVVIRFHGAVPEYNGLIGLGKEMESWIDCIRVKGKFEWLSPSAGKVMFHSHKQKPKPEKTVTMRTIEKEAGKMTEQIMENVRREVAEEEITNTKAQVSELTGVPKDIIEVKPRKETDEQTKKRLVSYGILGTIAREKGIV